MERKISLVEVYRGRDVLEAVEEVIKSGRFVKGPFLSAFEKEFAKYIGVRDAVSTSSGTAALWLAYEVLGVKEGAEFIVPSHTFPATVFPAMRMGARPVFVDINEDTFTMDVSQVREKSTEKTKAIVPVHIYGHPAEMKELSEIAEENGLYLIEDACQAHGATYEGRKVGSFGDLAAFSFFPSKVMTVGGDGGMVLGSNEDILEKIRMLHDQGRSSKYVHELVGYNYRMSEIQAAVGRVQLTHLESWIRRRREIARLYDELLSEVCITPTVNENVEHVYYVYTIRVKDRDGLSSFLKSRGISTGIYYPVPVHRQPPVIQSVGYQSLPVTERVVDEIISLPMHPFMSDEDVMYVADNVREYLEGKA